MQMSRETYRHTDINTLHSYQEEEVKTALIIKPRLLGSAHDKNSL